MNVIDLSTARTIGDTFPFDLALNYRAHVLGVARRYISIAPRNPLAVSPDQLRAAYDVLNAAILPISGGMPQFEPIRRVLHAARCVLEQGFAPNEYLDQVCQGPRPVMLTEPSNQEMASD